MYKSSIFETAVLFFGRVKKCDHNVKSSLLKLHKTFRNAKKAT